MTTDAAEESFKSQVETWLAAQMPIIQMHGGTSAVQKADPDSGEVVVELGGACSGCGISDRTAHNIKLDLAEEFPEVEEVNVRVGGDGAGGWDLDQPESFMGVERLEGGRGGTMEREGSDAESHF